MRYLFDSVYFDVANNNLVISTIRRGAAHFYFGFNLNPPPVLFSFLIFLSSSFAFFSLSAASLAFSKASAALCLVSSLLLANCSSFNFYNLSFSASFFFKASIFACFAAFAFAFYSNNFFNSSSSSYLCFSDFSIVILHGLLTTCTFPRKTCK